MAYGSVNVPGVSGAEFTAHTDDKNNPHAVTKEQIGLGNVDNTADADKPISIATQAALNQKANTAHAHAATDITLDSAHRFVTDSEKSTWNEKANSSHGTHVSYSSDAPAMNGTASAGNAATVARSDHVHPTDTSRAPIIEPIFSGYIIVGSATISDINAAAVGTNNAVSAREGFATGYGCEVVKAQSGAFGNSCTASGYTSFAFGQTCTAAGDRSFATGCNTKSSTGDQVAMGSFNVVSTATNDKLIIGKGTTNTARSNCFRVTHTGVYATGNYSSTGADYSELFEWKDGNPDNIDRVGLFVTLDGEYIRLANSEDDFIIGIVSGNPSVIGDVYDDQWQGMYLYDIYGRPLWEDVEVPDRYEERETVNENGEKIIKNILVDPAHIEHRQKINPDYDSSQPYQKRTERKEWGCVGMMGKLVVIDDGTCTVNGWVKPGNGGIATKSETQTKYRVMSRIDENHIKILIL